MEDESIWQEKKEILGRAEKLWPVEKEQDIILEKVADESSAEIIQEVREKRVTQASLKEMVQPKWRKIKRNTQTKESG